MAQQIRGALTDLNSTAINPEGMVIQDTISGRRYRYDRIYDGALTTRTTHATGMGSPVVLKTVDGTIVTAARSRYSVTTDVSDGYVTAPAGVLLATITAAKLDSTGYFTYGWIMEAGPLGQVPGEFPGLDTTTVTLITDTAVAAGECLVADAGDRVDTMADGEEEQVFAVAMNDDVLAVLSSGTVRVPI